MPVCGIIGGLLGGLFSRVLIQFGRGLPGIAGSSIKRNPIVFATLCGLGVAVIEFRARRIVVRRPKQPFHSQRFYSMKSTTYVIRPKPLCLTRIRKALATAASFDGLY